MSIDTEKVSILHWVSSDKHKCGYCGSPNSTSHGLWAERLTVDDYQNMIDRGWRRSGKYCYKPIMSETCCPQYTIRCAALSFKATKSQKKVLKKFNKYLKEGHSISTSSNTNCPSNDDTEIINSSGCNREDFIMPQAIKELGNSSNVQVSSASSLNSEKSRSHDNANINHSVVKTEKIVSSTGNVKEAKEVKKGVGADLSLPKCQKAKVLRQQRREAKLLEKGDVPSTSGNNSTQTTSKPTAKSGKLKSNNEKSLGDLINEESMDNLHNIQVKLIRPRGADWQQYKKVEFELYKKYQIGIHKDPVDKCSMKSFEHFLADSPLQSLNPAFGSFHQQYWLDDKLIAVGVIDILPKCVSSVYLFYDPDFNHLTLGTYSALREIDFTQRLHIKQPSIEYYYMGFYIHSCPKMRYKAKFLPSDLLCPETYAWTPIEQCLPLLDANKYSRLQKIDARDEEVCLPGLHLDEMKLVVDYTLYKAREFRGHPDYAESLVTLGRLLGKKLVASVFIVF